MNGLGISIILPVLLRIGGLLTPVILQFVCFVFLALEPIVVVFSQPGSGL
jgi:hypothetical protein